MNTRNWLKDLKTNVILPLRNGALRGDVEITEYDPSTGKLAQQYIGNKVIDSAKKTSIKNCNEMVKVFNAMVDAGRVTLEEALKIQEEFNRQDDRNAYLAAVLDGIRLREHEQEERKRREKEQKYQVYSRPDWKDSRTGLPHRIRVYDETGRKRSILELIIMLAILAIKKEHPVKPENYTIKAKVDYKAQAMMDTLRTAREENIQTPGEIDERLNQIGKELSRARAAVGRLADSKRKMDVINQAIADCRRLEGVCDRISAMPDNDLEKHIQMAQNAANFERYKQAKAIIYQAGLAAPEAREAFLARYDEISDKAAAAEAAASRYKEQYNRLSKLRYNVQLAQNRQYCYNLDYNPKFPDPEKETGPREFQKEAQQHRRKWNGADDNNGGFAGER